MNISEPATVHQERALPRTFSAWSFGHACLILIALMSPYAVAQTTIKVPLQPGETAKTGQSPGADSVQAPQTTISVTLQPGETTQTVQLPRADSVRVNYTTPEHLCNWPTPDHLKTSIENVARTGQLQQMLTQVENRGTTSGTAIAQALGEIEQMGGWPSYNGLFAGRMQVFTKQQLTQGPLTFEFATRCLNLQEARIGIYEIQRIIRAYLGLPAPTLHLQTPTSGSGAPVSADSVSGTGDGSDKSQSQQGQQAGAQSQAPISGGQGAASTSPGDGSDKSQSQQGQQAGTKDSQGGAVRCPDATSC